MLSTISGFDWQALLPILGVSGALGGGVSALINHFVTVKDLKRGASTKIAEERLRLYRHFQFDLKYFVSILESIGDIQQVVLDNPGTLKRMEEAFDIIDSTARNQLHLLTSNVYEKWFELKKLYSNSHKDHKQARQIANDLITLLDGDYKNICKLYKKGVGKGSKYLMLELE